MERQLQVTDEHFAKATQKPTHTAAEMPEIEGTPGHSPVASKRKSPGVSGAFASIQLSELYGSTPYGSRTRVIGLRIRYPGPLDEGGEGQRCIGAVA